MIVPTKLAPIVATVQKECLFINFVVLRTSSTLPINIFNKIFYNIFYKILYNIFYIITKGYYMDVDDKTCIDIDECACDAYDEKTLSSISVINYGWQCEKKGGCEQICSNIDGTFECSCNIGYS